MKQALANVELTENRAEWVKGKNGEQILSDVYNSNPTAAKEVLKTDCRNTSRWVVGPAVLWGHAGLGVLRQNCMLAYEEIDHKRLLVFTL